MEILRPEQQLMEAALRVRSTRADLLAANVANAETPGYQSRDLNFESALSVAMGDGENPGISSSADAAAQNISLSRNNVDVNQQLARAYVNSLDYVATLKLYGDSVARLKAATSSS